MGRAHQRLHRIGERTTFRLYRRRRAGEIAGPALIAWRQSRAAARACFSSRKRRVAQRQLEARGCVRKTDQPAAALESSASERVDLRFSNSVMPGGSSGVELARTAISRWSRLKAPLTSGFPEAKSNRPGCACCPKPYRDDDLARALRESLDTSRPAKHGLRRPQSQGNRLEFEHVRGNLVAHHVEIEPVRGDEVAGVGDDLVDVAH